MPRKGLGMKTYLVTGGNSGIGKAIALKLAVENHVIILGRNEIKKGINWMGLFTQRVLL